MYILKRVEITCWKNPNAFYSGLKCSGQCSDGKMCGFKLSKDCNFTILTLPKNLLLMLLIGGERNFASWQKYLWFSFLKHILSMQVPLWNKTAISSCTEFMDKKIHAQLSESHCKDLFLYEIILFLVFDLCQTFSGVINEWMQKSESDYHQKHRVQFKDQDFLAGNSCIIEINSC